MSVYYVERQLYLKRRTKENVFETDSIRIDTINNKDIVVNWGEITKEVNYRNYDINNFSISPMRICLDNSSGFFYDESRQSSLWNGYLTRIYSKINILVSINGGNLENIYLGFIDDIKNTYDKKTYITLQPQQYILNKFDIKDLSLENEITCEDLLTKIFNNNIINIFIKQINIKLEIKHVIINKPGNLHGTYWEIIKYICLITNSYVYFENEILFIIPKNQNSGESDVTLVSHDYETGGDDVIYSIGNFDDEGHKKIRLKFKDKTGSYEAVSTNKNVLDKYLGITDSVADTEIVDISNISEFYKQIILNNLIAFWERPRRSLEIETNFNNKLNLLKKINIDIREKSGNELKWGHFYWDNMSRWGTIGEGFVIYKEKNWIIKYIRHDLNFFKSKIHIEEI